MALILIADDEMLIGELLAEIVQAHGHAVLMAANGRVALQLAITHVPDLIFSDLMMPLMTGYEFLQALRQTPALAHIRFILMSAVHVDAHEHVPFHPDAFLPKPFPLVAFEALLPPFSEQ